MRNITDEGWLDDDSYGDYPGLRVDSEMSIAATAIGLGVDTSSLTDALGSLDFMLLSDEEGYVIGVHEPRIVVVFSYSEVTDDERFARAVAASTNALTENQLAATVTIGRVEGYWSSNHLRYKRGPSRIVKRSRHPEEEDFLAAIARVVNRAKGSRARERRVCSACHGILYRENIFSYGYDGDDRVVCYGCAPSEYGVVF